MKTRTKIALLAAVCCIIAGSIAVFLALKTVNFDFREMNTMKFDTKIYEVTDHFQNIEIYGLECSVDILPSPDGKCTVVYPESERMTNTIEVNNGTLVITRKDVRKWYERIGFFFGFDNRITLYLPESDYGSLYLKNVSGDIEVPDSFSFEKTELYSVSGDISFGAGKSGDIIAKSTSGEISVTCPAAGSVSTETVSGDIRLSGINASGIKAKATSGDVSAVSVEASGNVDIETVSGDATISNSDADSLRIKTTSGEVSVMSVTVAKNADIDTVSGDVALSSSDARSLSIKTTSGDVEGSLRSPKRFVTETSSGSVMASSSSDPNAGECRVKTTSGDIRISTPNA